MSMDKPDKGDTSIIAKAMGKLEDKLKAPIIQPPVVKAEEIVAAPAFESPLNSSGSLETGRQVSGENQKSESSKVHRDALVFKSSVDFNSEQEERITHQIQLAKLESLGMVSPNFPRKQIAEEYRSIKRPLLKNMEAKGASKVAGGNLIMVTSGMSTEGKTFTAVNLAISMAMEQDRTVLLVDADVTKASAARLLGIDDDLPGLIDVLEGQVQKFSDVLVHTNIPKLRVLPAGHLHDHATELLASENMKSLMSELSSRYPDRVIIFDSPPLLMTSEASVLASHMGQIVFVVAAEQSVPAAVKEALEKLGKDKIIGLVLNKARPNPFVGLAYGYSYGYGYGYGDDRRRVRKEKD